MKTYRKIFRTARRCGMTAEERAGIRERVESFMLQHPKGSAGMIADYRWQRYARILSVTRLAPVAVMVLMAAGATVSLASEGSVPGDALYTVKRSVTEPVRGLIARARGHGAEWQIRMLERRLEETETLSARDSLTETLHRHLARSFDDHTDRVSRMIADVETSGDLHGAAVVSSRLEATLRAHEKIMNRMRHMPDAVVSDSTAAADRMHQRIRRAKEEAHAARTDLEFRIAENVQGSRNQTAAEQKMWESEKKISEADDYLALNRTSIDSGVTEVASARLDLARETHERARGLVDQSMYGEAFVLFQRAHRIAQEARHIMMLSKKLELTARLPIQQAPAGTSGGEGGQAGIVESADDADASGVAKQRREKQKLIRQQPSAAPEDKNQSGSIPAGLPGRGMGTALIQPVMFQEFEIDFSL